MFLHLEIKIQSFRNQSWKSSQSMNKIQKFLRVINRHEAANFLVFWVFLLRSIFGHFLRPHGSKNDRSQKSYLNRKSVFMCPSTSWRNFWILFMLWLNFHDWFMKLWALISRWRNIFQKKFLTQIISFGTLAGLTWGWIKKPWMTSNGHDKSDFSLK